MLTLIVRFFWYTFINIFALDNMGVGKLRLVYKTCLRTSFGHSLFITPYVSATI